MSRFWTPLAMGSPAAICTGTASTSLAAPSKLMGALACAMIAACGAVPTAPMHNPPAPPTVTPPTQSCETAFATLFKGKRGNPFAVARQNRSSWNMAARLGTQNVTLTPAQVLRFRTDTEDCEVPVGWRGRVANVQVSAGPSGGLQLDDTQAQVHWHITTAPLAPDAIATLRRRLHVQEPLQLDLLPYPTPTEADVVAVGFSDRPRAENTRYWAVTSQDSLHFADDANPVDLDALPTWDAHRQQPAEPHALSLNLRQLRHDGDSVYGHILWQDTRGEAWITTVAIDARGSVRTDATYALPSWVGVEPQGLVGMREGLGF